MRRRIIKTKGRTYAVLPIDKGEAIVLTPAEWNRGVRRAKRMDSTIKLQEVLER